MRLVPNARQKINAGNISKMTQKPQENNENTVCTRLIKLPCEDLPNIVLYECIIRNNIRINILLYILLYTVYSGTLWFARCDSTKQKFGVVHIKNELNRCKYRTVVLYTLQFRKKITIHQTFLSNSDNPKQYLIFSKIYLRLQLVYFIFFKNLSRHSQHIVS